MRDRTCLTCKHWHGFPGEGPHAFDEEFRCCHRALTIYQCKSAWPGDGPLLSHCDFGCIHHTNKDADEQQDPAQLP